MDISPVAVRKNPVKMRVRRGENERLTADDYRRMAHNAVSDLLSIGADKPVPRNRVSLL